MTLRARLVLIGGLIALLVLAVDGILVYNQYNFAITQVDSELANLQKQASKIVRFVDAGGDLSASESAETTTTQEANKVPIVPSVYIGLRTSDGSLKTYSTPPDTAAVPRLEDVTQPEGKTVRFETALADVPNSLPINMRVILIPQGRDALVIGTPLTEVMSASGQLATNAAIGWGVLVVSLVLTFFWVSRLGLRPIRQVADVARGIRSGDKSKRVPEFPAATEAQQLGAAVNDLLDMNQRVEENLRRFVSDAAHELRTPLTAISGYASLFERGQLTEHVQIADAMRRIHEESSRMTRLVNDLLTLATLDRDSAVAKEITDVVPIVDAVLSDMRVIDEHHSYSRHGDQAAIINIDPDRLTQLLVILLTNAKDHSPTNSSVTVTVRREDDLVISIENVGSPISPQDSERVFDRFARLDDSRSRVSGRGTGLGLAIARAIVDALGGTISLTSREPSEGAAIITLSCRFSAA